MSDDLDNLRCCLAQTRRELLHARKAIARLETGVEWTSQFGEDLLAWELLGKPKSGYFIEAGAYDGYHYSATWGLEQLGWHGLLVEPVLSEYDKCRKNRRRAGCVRACLGYTEGQVTIFVRQDGMFSSASPNGMENWRGLESVVTHTEIVRATSLNTLLRPGQQVDLAVIDVEGSELDVLKGFDLEAHKPRIMIIEDNSRLRNPALQEYLTPRGYRFCGLLEVNQIWIRADQAEILDRLLWIVSG
jgi:FkbM family methyltransferase